MTTNIFYQPLTAATYDQYIAVGTLAYNQHYRHLWVNGDSTPYIQHSFTKDVLSLEEADNNTALYLIKTENKTAGILKITLNKGVDKYSKEEALYVDKIYIQKEFTGMGIGKITLDFVTDKAKNLEKRLIFLEAMQKGLALPFYLKNDFKIVGRTQIPFKGAIEEEKPMYILIKELHY
ncbi:MAG: GNAT family N-acetyltransferase [Maribacter sp.]